MVSNVAVLVTSRSTIFDVLRVLHGDNSFIKDHCKVYLKKENFFRHEMFSFLIFFLTLAAFCIKGLQWNIILKIIVCTYQEKR